MSDRLIYFLLVFGVPWTLALAWTIWQAYKTGHIKPFLKGAGGTLAFFAYCFAVGWFAP